MINKCIAIHKTPVGLILTSTLNVFLRAAAFIFTLTPVVYFWLVVELISISNTVSVSGILAQPEPLLIFAMGMLILVRGVDGTLTAIVRLIKKKAGTDVNVAIGQLIVAFGFLLCIAYYIVAIEPQPMNLLKLYLPH